MGSTNAVNADLVGSIANPIDPLLGPLQMNGGATFTHALLLGSPAIDQGNSFGEPTDQRGHPGHMTIQPSPTQLEEMARTSEHLNWIYPSSISPSQLPKS